MHRGYKRATVYRAVSELRRVKDNPFIGVDIITGFPGETEEDFKETYGMCRELNFAGIHAFPFSAREQMRGKCSPRCLNVSQGSG